MKLSLKRKRGWTQVVGGKAVRVKIAHAVSTLTLSQFANRDADFGDGPARPQERFSDGEKHVFAEPGDLAFEIVTAKGGELVGWTYLSGKALQLNCYEALPEWFEAAEAAWITIPRPEDEIGGKMAFIETVARVLMTAKHARDLSAFEYLHKRRDDPKHIATILADLYGHYAPTDGTEARGHVVGVVGRGLRRRGGIHVHFQPARDASPWAATGFQSALVLEALKKGQ